MSWFPRIFRSGGASSGSYYTPHNQNTVPGPDDIVESIEEGDPGNNAPSTGHGGQFRRSPAPSQRSPSYEPPTPPDDDIDEEEDAGSPPQDEEEQDEEEQDEEEQDEEGQHEEDWDEDGMPEREESLGTQVRNCHEELREAQDRAKVLKVERDIAQEDLQELQGRERICPICERTHDDAATRNLCILRHRRQLNRCRRRRGRREYPTSPVRGRARGSQGHSPAQTSQGTSVSPRVSRTSGNESSEDELNGPTTIRSANRTDSRNQSSGSSTRRRSSSSSGSVPSETPPVRRRRRPHDARASSTSSDGLVPSTTPPGRRRRRLAHVAIPPRIPVPADRRLTRRMLHDGKGSLTARLP